MVRRSVLYREPCCSYLVLIMGPRNQLPVVLHLNLVVTVLNLWTVRKMTSPGSVTVASINRLCQYSIRSHSLASSIHVPLAADLAATLDPYINLQSIFGTWIILLQSVLALLYPVLWMSQHCHRIPSCSSCFSMTLLWPSFTWEFFSI